MDSNYRVFSTRLFIFPRPTPTELIFSLSPTADCATFFKERAGKIAISYIRSMSSKKSINEELEELTTIYQRGGGIGEPALEQEIERRIDFLKHKQAHDLNKKSVLIAALNIILTLINVAILIYQLSR